MLEESDIDSTLALYVDLEYLSLTEAEMIGDFFAPDFPFREALTIAETIHIQVKVADTESLPHDAFVAGGAQEVRSLTNFRKYSHPGGLSVIFTSGPIAEEDLIPGAVTSALPFVDHFGIDLREDSPEARAIYEDLPRRAVESDWRHVQQGGPQKPVRGCHCEVAEKSWVYPPRTSTRRPIEFAFGELALTSEDVGCDYRPIDPAHPLARLVPRTTQARAPQIVTIDSAQA